MTLSIAAQIEQVRTMRRQLDAAREIAPPDEWAVHDAQLREIEDDLDEIVALTHHAVQKFETPTLWTRIPDEGEHHA